MLKKIKILVTGGAGFLGSELAEKLAENSENFVVIVDNLLTGRRHNLPPSNKDNIRFIKANVNNYDEISPIMLTYKFNYVFHYAALVGVSRTLNNPMMVLEDIHGIENILKLSKNSSVKRIYFASSSEVYGEPLEIPQNEDTTPLNSKLPYAVVKNLGEAFLKAYNREYGLEYTVFRIFNTYGSKQSTDFVIPKFLKAALSNNDISIYGDGKQTRTFLFVDDNIEVCLKAFYEKKFINDVVNVGNDVEISIIDLAEKILRITNSNSRLVYLPPLDEGDMSRRKPDITKMKKLLKRNLVSLSEGLERLFNVIK